MDNTPPASDKNPENSTPVNANNSDKASEFPKAFSAPATATVKSYQDEVWISTWKRRSASLWAGALTGLVVGAGIGGLACLSTALLEALTLSTAIALMPVVVPALAMFGVTAGIATFTTVGASSGAVAHGLKEQDKRKLRPGEEPPSVRPAKERPLINWKVAITAGLAAAAMGGIFVMSGGFGVIGALSGAVDTAITAAAGAPLIEGLVASTVNTLTVSSFALFGTLFSVDMPKISNQLTNFMGSFLSGRLFEEGVKTSIYQPSPEKTVPVPEIVAPALNPRSPAKAPKIAFKEDTIKNMVVPIGSYAGKQGGYHVRKLAEQQFSAMEPGQATRH